MASTDRKPPRFLFWAVVLGVAWGQFVLITGTLGEPTLANWTLLASIETAGLYTLVLYLMRGFWLPPLSRWPRRTAILLGIFNALIVEAVFWAFERLFGANGVAASHNLFLDWALTMPWYIGMVILFVRGQERSHLLPLVVFLLGGLYELGADGVVGGQVVPAIIGTPVNLLQSWLFLVTIAFWQFVIVYSSMVLPPAWVLASARTADSRGSSLVNGLLPLAWLVPYTLYLLIALVLFAR